uniref:HECT-type E3 ubiquitin transferase E3D n=1 Tax=Spongospora subterranea TaxID=70186 RepID=A0A0H5RBR3_9EUKA|eukprot:CRZ11052.1 hypothetical protein [Spongospora subterranea]
MNDDDLIHVSVEKFQHMKRLMLTVWTKGPCPIVELRLNRARLYYPSGEPIEILFDCHIAHERARRSDSSDPEYTIITITCPITLDVKRDYDLDLPAQSELSTRSRQLVCRSCDTPFADLSNLEGAYPLPCDHWMEMSELWVCDPSTMSHIQNPYGLPDRPLDEAALPTRVLIGLRDVIVPAETIVDNRTSSDKDGMMILCCKCQSNLGSSIPNGFRIWKMAILASDECTDNPRSRVFSFYTDESDAVALILQQCHSRSHYLAVVSCDDPNQEDVLCLQICNWDSFAIDASYLKTGNCLSLQRRSPVDPNRFAPVIKVYYRFQPELQPKDAAFVDNAHVERIQLTTAQWKSVKQSLHRSSHCYPPTQRMIGNMSKGYLHRLSRII